MHAVLIVFIFLNLIMDISSQANDEITDIQQAETETEENTNGNHALYIPSLAVDIFQSIWQIFSLGSDEPLEEDHDGRNNDVVHKCGIRTRRRPRSKRVVNGSVARQGDWPWMAYIMWIYGEAENIRMANCGATLITDRFLITAAHCVMRNGSVANPADLTLFMGVVNLLSAGASSKYVHSARQVFVNGQNDRKYSYNNDVGLIKLWDPVKTTNLISPICLPNHGETFTGRLAHVIGWGNVDGRAEGPNSYFLRAAVVQVLSRFTCIKWYLSSTGKLIPLGNGSFCAGHSDGHADSCFGDSGGPLMVERKEGGFVLAGIVSGGRGCGVPKQPGIYVEVEHFLPWINKTIEENNGDEDIINYNGDS